jgi:hypothetical protein
MPAGAARFGARHQDEAGPSGLHASEAGPSGLHADEAGPSGVHAGEAGPSGLHGYASSGEERSSGSDGARPSKRMRLGDDEDGGRQLAQLVTAGLLPSQLCT